jgi:transcriptional regulator with XRE-family HTH domain
MTKTDMPKKIHHGYNVKRLREILSVKQETLASKLGEEWTARRVQGLEDKETIEDALLEEVAKALGVTADSIKNFDEEKMFFYIQNNYDSSNQGATNNGPYSFGPQHAYHQCTINPIDELSIFVKKNEALHAELLKVEREKNALLERLLSEKK